VCPPAGAGVWPIPPREQYGMAIVLATHEPGIAARCDRYIRPRRVPR
jgi:hypothetical protein